jgi:hypothetical protein
MRLAYTHNKPAVKRGGKEFRCIGLELLFGGLGLMRCGYGWCR